jgi:hypothetical protein
MKKNTGSSHEETDYNDDAGACCVAGWLCDQFAAVCGTR